MPGNLITRRPKWLSQLAQAWLEAGAAAVAIRHDGQCLTCWGEVGQAADTTLPIMVGGGHWGDLLVTGSLDPVGQARLAADVALIGQIVRLDREGEALTNELIEVQDQLLALYQIDRIAGGALSLSESFQLLARETARLLKAEAALIGMTGDGDRSLTSVCADGSPGPALAPALYRRLQEAGCEQLIDYGDQGEDGLRSLMFVPIQLRDTVIAGGLIVVNRPIAGIGSPDLKLARGIATHIGTVIERGLLYQAQISQLRLQTEMDLARSIQSRLLENRPPQLPGLSIFARSVPALQVGGDFYSFVQPAGRPCTFTLGDITGKGMPAALLMTMVRSSLRSKASYLPDPAPALVMRRSNEDLYDDFTEVGMFATVFVGQLLPEQGQVRFANAGHAPVIYHPHGGRPRLLEADGPPMGVLPMSLCAEQGLPFRPGDLLVVATDGFTEAQDSAGEMLGIERLLELVEEHAHQDAEAIGAALFAATELFSAGRSPDDDRTLIVIKGNL